MPSKSLPTKFIPQGAILQSLLLHDKDLVLNFSSPLEYRDNPAHFGATIGRVTNRIQNALIQNLNGGPVRLTANDGHHTLHGGRHGWGVQDFRGPESELIDGRELVRFRYTSVHGDEKFPGDVEVCVTYRPYEDDGSVVLEMEYEARLVRGAEETVVNLTNHTYFNIGPGDNIAGTQATLSTNVRLLLDETGVPISTTPAVHPGILPGHAFTLGAHEPDFDDCFLLNKDPASIPLDTRSSPLNKCASFYHPETGIHLDVQTTEPAFQFYTGKHIDVEARADGSPRRGARAGFCVEPSRYVNAANADEWRGMTVVRKGEVYGSTIVYRAWKD